MSTTTSLGQKHSCATCSAKFYDMNKAAPTCPKCDTAVVVAPPPRVIRQHQPAIKPAKAAGLHVKGDNGAESGEIDTIDALEEDEDILVSLSELEDRESSDRLETDDDVHEEDLMEDMKNYDTILDDAHEEDGDAEAQH